MLFREIVELTFFALVKPSDDRRTKSIEYMIRKMARTLFNTSRSVNSRSKLGSIDLTFHVQQSTEDLLVGSEASLLHVSVVPCG